jgi:hypothetical protein
MSDSVLFGWLFRYIRRRKRDRDLHEAEAWPVTTAKRLKGTVVPKDELAEGSLAQSCQIEFPYYFVMDDGFFGGHLRTVPCSDSEGRRWIAKVDEGAPVTVRYDPRNPDRTHALAADNEGALPFSIWSM